MTLHLYWPLRKIDPDRREVYGYASTEAEDSQGEIVARAALEAALPAYMRFANIREMHQPSAVGVAKEAAVDDKGLFVKAQIVDAEAWVKVKEGVYKGFSIGGTVTARDPGDPRIITGVELTEISLVDRPANPEAVFAVWKSRDGKERIDMSVLTPEALRNARARLAQRWVASDGSAFDKAEAAARHEAALGKEASFAPAAAPTAGLTTYALEGAADGKGDDAAADFADPGFRDGKKRYPLDSERHIRAAWTYIHQKRNQQPYSKDELDHIKTRIVAAWKAKIDRDGPPAARGKAVGGGDLGKGLGEVARLALLIQELEWLRLAVAERQDEDGDASTVPADFQAAVAHIAAVLRAMVDEETAGLVAGDDDEDPDFETALKRAAAALPLAQAAALRPLVRGARLAKADGGVLARLGQLGDLLAKDGAALGAVEEAHVQDIHDHAVALGARCDGAGVTKGAGAIPPRLGAREDELAAALPLLREVKELVEKVAAQPAVTPPSRLVAVDKGADVARELDRIAAQPPAMTAFELIKRALREPLPFGAPLEK